MAESVVTVTVYGDDDVELEEAALAQATRYFRGECEVWACTFHAVGNDDGGSARWKADITVCKWAGPGPMRPGTPAGSPRGRRGPATDSV